MTDQVEQNKGKSLPDNRDKVAATELETDKLFKLNTPDGLISETGMRELQSYLYDQGLGELPLDFEAKWTGKRGTLPKRVTAHCYKVNKIKLSPIQISAIGNIVRPHSSEAETFLCDFTKRFDWSSGDFGDSGSCFWGSNSGAKLMLEENGAYAFRLYKWNKTPELRLAEPSYSELEYKNVRGYSRCWVVRIASDKLIAFNGYPDGSLNLARLLALKFNCSYKKINVTNHGEQGGML